MVLPGVVWLCMVLLPSIYVYLGNYGIVAIVATIVVAISVISLALGPSIVTITTCIAAVIRVVISVAVALDLLLCPLGLQKLPQQLIRGTTVLCADGCWVKGI